MPKNVAQLTGMIVTAIIVFGTDMDVYYAMPLGIFAGALATMFVGLSEYRAAREELVPIKIRRR
ncbi:MAG TPA: hypothetical protein VHE09_10620 [Rhizomicrobium sp.]|jgi:hypothetical protein|nr:hypothetical protein [Rhizomicrobium sp.]